MKTFKKIFGNYTSSDISEVFCDAEITGIKIYKEQRILNAEILSEAYIKSDILKQTEEQIKSALELNSVLLQIIYKNVPFKIEYMSDIIAQISRSAASLGGYLQNAPYKMEGEKIIITLENGGLNLLKAADMAEKIEKKIGTMFNTDIKIEFAGITEASVQTAETAAAEAIEKIKEQQRKENATKKRTDIPPDGKLYYPDSAKPIYGNPIKISPTDIRDVDPLVGKIAIWGDIFKFDSVETKYGGKFRITFYITDYTSSYIIKIPDAIGYEAQKVNRLKKGDTVLVYGSIAPDQYENHEYVLTPTSISTLERYRISDNSEEKRVELHTHTNMSKLDAVTPVDKLIERAYNYGHKAVAITDHGVLQAYPGAMYAVENIRKKGGDFKVIYGVEAYYINDIVPAVTGVKSEPLDGEFVIFDLETTGFDKEKDRITEIGAVRIRNGQITDEFMTFVNPGILIPSNVTALNGISDETVKDAPFEAEIIPIFLDFIKDAVLVAHNADFDMGMLKAAAYRQGILITNTYIDTVPIARKLMPELENHKLNTVAAACGYGDFDHHRACDDAKVLSQIFIKFTQKLNIENISGLNSTLSGVNAKKDKQHHIIILVKNGKGLRRLYELVSDSHIKNLGYLKRPTILRSELMKERDGLIIGSACEQGELYDAVIKGKKWGELLDIASFYDYFEIQPLGNNEFMVRKNEVHSIEEIKKYNKTIIEFGRKLNIPVVATGDVHFMDKHDDRFRAIIQAGSGFDDADFQAPLYFRTTEEMLFEFDYLDGQTARDIVINNTNKIADMIDDDIRPIPKGNYAPSIEGSEETLRTDATKKAKEMYGDPLPPPVEKRLTKELDAIISHGFAVMYVAAQKLVRDSVDNGYLVGSRGSVGSSFTATMIDVSEVNPLVPHYLCSECKYSEFFENGEIGSGFDLQPKNCPKCGNNLIRDGQDIPFETFLGFKGDKVPDIDLNFSGEYQTAAQKHTEKLFGEGNVFKAGTISAIKDKTAYGYVSKYVEERQKTDEAFYLNKAERERFIIGCTGVKSTTGQHAGGMIVVPADKSIYDFTPIQKPADDLNSDMTTTHFDFRSIHDTLLKLDILGHDVPSIYKYLEDYTGIPVLSVPMSDAKVMSLFTSSKALNVSENDIDTPTGTLSLPEFGAANTRRILTEAKPKTFADLLQISGLSHGEGIWAGNAQDLIKNGTCTISEVIGTRDNVMLYLIHKGLDENTAFQITEAVRKKDTYPTDAHVKMMIDCGVPQWYIDSCMKIEYMFPKAHASAYVISALRFGWYKINYPLEYYAAYFTVRSENLDGATLMKGRQAVRAKINDIAAKGKTATAKEDKEHAMLMVANEMLCRNVEILPVDFKKSHAVKFLPENGKIRLPFVCLNGVGDTAAEALYNAAKEDNFISQEDIGSAAGVGKAVLETLDEAGAFGDMPKSNQLTLF